MATRLDRLERNDENFLKKLFLHNFFYYQKRGIYLQALRIEEEEKFQASLEPF